jgi:hypothetical protein
MCGEHRQSLSFQEPRVEGKYHQNDTDVHHEPFPESIPEEQYINGDDDSHHDRNTNEQYRSCHNIETIRRSCERSQDGVLRR